MNEVEIHIGSDNRIVPYGIVLEDSWILGWSIDGDDLQIEMEFSIWPESPFYNEPLNDEYTCYKTGTLTFHNIKSMKGFKEFENTKPTIDPDGSKDWGSIYGLSKNNNFVSFSTEENDVEIESTELTIKLNAL
jgi:hypothetical protein